MICNGIPFLYISPWIACLELKVARWLKRFGRAAVLCYVVITDGLYAVSLPGSVFRPAQYLSKRHGANRLSTCAVLYDEGGWPFICT